MLHYFRRHENSNIDESKIFIYLYYFVSQNIDYSPQRGIKFRSKFLQGHSNFQSLRNEIFGIVKSLRNSKFRLRWRLSKWKPKHYGRQRLDFPIENGSFAEDEIPSELNGQIVQIGKGFGKILKKLKVNQHSSYLLSMKNQFKVTSTQILSR